MKEMVFRLQHCPSVLLLAAAPAHTPPPAADSGGGAGPRGSSQEEGEGRGGVKITDRRSAEEANVPLGLMSERRGRRVGGSSHHLHIHAGKSSFRRVSRLAGLKRGH